MNGEAGNGLAVRQGNGEMMRKGRYLRIAQGAEKMLELLELLAIGGEKTRIGELADKLGISRRETLIMLVILESRSLLSWDARERLYRPTRKTADLLRFNGGREVVLAKDAMQRSAKVSRPGAAHNKRGGVRQAAAGV